MLRYLLLLQLHYILLFCLNELPIVPRNIKRTQLPNPNWSKQMLQATVYWIFKIISRMGIHY